MNYADWQTRVPESIKADSLWQMAAYRLALFFGDIAWADVTRLSRDRRTAAVSDQLYRSVGSISANLAEGYSRGTGRDRARFYEYALGSAREARDWYFKGRHLLGESVGEHRFRFLAEIIRLLLTMVPEQRGSVLKEAKVPYRVDRGPQADPLEPPELDALLHAVPLPTTENHP